MTIKFLEEEDNIPLSQVVKLVNKKSKEILRVIDALNLGRTSVQKDGVYRTFTNGQSVKVADGNFKDIRIPQKVVKLF